MKHFAMLIKPASSLCNLRCRYCFYADVASNRECENFGIMSNTTMYNLIDRTLDHFKEAAHITFAFQGGEPTCAGIEYFKNFISYVNKQKQDFHNVSYTIQTNATLLDEAWMALFSEHKFLVGVSLDGFIKNHNLNRKDASGKDTYAKIMKNIELLRENKIEFNILSVLTSSLAKHPEELYVFYKKNNFDYIQLIPCLPAIGNTYDEYSLRPKEFASFYKKFFDLWYQDYLQHDYLNVTLFDNLIPMFAGIPPQQCGYLGVCNCQFVVEGDGSVYPCDFYVLDDYKLGNINNDSILALSKSLVVTKFLEEKHRVCQLCNNCRYLSICHGQCKRLNINYFTETYCGYQDFIMSKEKEIMSIAARIQ